MPTLTALHVASTEHGCVIRVQGRGTMKQSPAAREVALKTLGGDEAAAVVVDLSDCEYLDSTFLGFLAEMYNKFGRKDPLRFFVSASSDVRAKLLHPVRIDTLIPSLDVPPETRGQWVAVSMTPLEPRELSRHVMECHRVLSQADSPMSEKFAKIADQLECELAKTP